MWMFCKSGSAGESERGSSQLVSALVSICRSLSFGRCLSAACLGISLTFSWLLRFVFSRKNHAAHKLVVYVAGSKMT